MVDVVRCQLVLLAQIDYRHDKSSVASHGLFVLAEDTGQFQGMLP